MAEDEEMILRNQGGKRAEIMGFNQGINTIQTRQNLDIYPRDGVHSDSRKGRDY